MLSLDDPLYCFHQTFTFAGKVMFDERQAKRRLNRTLDLLHKIFEMVSIYVTEGESEQRLHYQVVFLFYTVPEGISPSHLEDRFRGIAFAAWSRANDNKVTQSANAMTVRTKDFETLSYFTKEVRLVPRKKQALKVKWSGARPRGLMARHKKQKSKTELNREVREAFNRLFAFQIFHRMAAERKDVWDKKLLRAFKTAIVASGCDKSWHEHTKRMGYRVRPIPDRQFIEFKNSGEKKKPWTKEDSARGPL
jgi:hypothetical protein